MFVDGDATVFNVKGNDHETGFNASYTLPVRLPSWCVPSFLLFPNASVYLGHAGPIPAVLGFSRDIETNFSKYASVQKSLILHLSSIYSPWRIKLLREHRQNKFDSFQSKRFLMSDALPSYKHALVLEYEKISGEQLTRLSTEIALPVGDQACSRSASFVKVEARHTKQWRLIDGKVNLVCDLQAGKMLPLSRNGIEGRSFINDRFFLFNTSGYQCLGHSEPSLKGNSRDIDWSEDDKKDEERNL